MRWQAAAIPACLALAACGGGAGDPPAKRRPRPQPPRRRQRRRPSEPERAPVRLTIAASGDLLPHLPIVARARALGGGGLRLRADVPFAAPADPPRGPGAVPRRDAARAGRPGRLSALPLAPGARARDPQDGLGRVQHGLEPQRRRRPGRNRQHAASAAPRRRRPHRVVRLASRPQAAAAHGRARRAGRAARLHGDHERPAAAASVVREPGAAAPRDRRRAPRAAGRRRGGDREHALGHGVQPRSRCARSGASRRA